MIERLLIRLGFPKYPSFDLTRRARIVYGIALISLIATLLGGVIFSVGLMSSTQLLFTVLGLLGVWSALLILARIQATVGLASATLIAAVFITVAAISLLSDGIRNTVSLGYPVVIVLAAVLFGTPGALLAMIVSSLTSIVLYTVDVTGIYVFNVPQNPVPADLIIQQAFIIITALLLQVTSRDEQRALAEAQQVAAQLDILRVELEERVIDRTAALERRASQLQAAADVGRAIATFDDLEQLLTQVTYLISDSFGFYHVGIFLIDEPREYAVLRAANSTGGQQMLARQHRLQVGMQGIVGFVTSQGQPRIALDVGADAVFFNNPDLPETRSEMALPLRSAGQIIGALDVQSTESDAFSSEDVQVLQTLADQVSVAISNTLLFQQLQQRIREERQATGQVTRQSWQNYLITRDQPGAISRAVGATEPFDASTTAWHPDMVDAHRYAMTVRNDDDTVAIPIKLRGDQVAGVVRLRKPSGESWRSDEIDLMESLTEQLSVALESARLYDDTQRRAARERLIGEVTTNIRETLDIDTVLQTAVREIGERLNLAQVEVRLASGTPPTESRPPTLEQKP